MQRQILNQLDSLKANPAKYLAQRQMNIPENMMDTPQHMIESITGQKIPDEYINSPKDYMNYLLSNNQVPKQQQNQMMNMLGMFI